MKIIDQLTILFVDDEPSIISALRRFLRKEPYKMVFAANGREALKIFKAQNVQLVVTDLRMPEMGGLELITKIKEISPETVRIILSASRDVSQTIESINSGEVYRFIPKPLDPEPFKQMIRAAAEYYILKTGRQELMEELSISNEYLKQALETIYSVREKKDKLEAKARDVERRIEQYLLQTDVPMDIVGAAVAATSIPSGHLDGDFFDLIHFDSGKFDLVLADVMGKGVQSALVGAGIKGMILKVLAQHNCLDFDYDIKVIAHCISHVHEMAIKKLLKLEMFVTLCYARFDLECGQMAFVDCGHTKSLHYQATTGKCVFLEGDNLPLGIIEDAEYHVVIIPAEKNDLFVFYSDGITEAENSQDEQFGAQRLAALLEKYHDFSAQQLVVIMEQAVRDFSGKEYFADDLSCIVVQIV